MTAKIKTKLRKQLEQSFQDIIKGNLPKTNEEFLGRANLYHILMSLEEFLLLKKEFITSVASTYQFKKDYHFNKLNDTKTP